MRGPEFYECGRLKLVTGMTGCGKTHSVREWLMRTEQSVLLVCAYPKEYPVEQLRGKHRIVDAGRLLASGMRDVVAEIVLRLLVRRESTVVVDFSGGAEDAPLCLNILAGTRRAEVILLSQEGPEQVNDYLGLDLRWKKAAKKDVLV